MEGSGLKFRTVREDTSDCLGLGKVPFTYLRQVLRVHKPGFVTSDRSCAEFSCGGSKKPAISVILL